MGMKNWELRREVMGWDVDETVRLAMIIAIDHFDWNTMNKVFQNKAAYEKWIHGLGKRYNIEPVFLKMAVTLLKATGVITVTEAGDLRVMTLGEPTKKEQGIKTFETFLAEIRRETDEDD